MITLNRSQIVPKETPLKIPFFVAVGNIILGSLFLAVFWIQLPPQVPLFFSKPWGESQLAKPIFLTLPLFLSFIFLLTNLLLSQIAEDYPFLKRVLITGAALVSTLSAIFVIRTVLLII